MKNIHSKIKRNAGMTYVELIVVLSIFAVVSSVSLFNYGQFQGKVDVKNLANDVALRIVEAQKNALTGKFDNTAGASWRPSYGVHFDVSNASNATKVVQFTDLNSNNRCDPSQCNFPPALGGEVTSIVNINKNNYVSSIEVIGTGCPATVNNLSITYRRPNTSPEFRSTPPIGCTVSNVIINLTSPRGATSRVKVYKSGIININ